ncbi:hypothetical protein Y032_0025g1205 [Ancylostoma ceylanicum]|uniref:Uncharacterized protein n=1 Tax=Ancylostoma ceylanicum TaxID=53326 RepID=A0A016UVF2_9BILA|nr:hypothetical protein Y032_0025g1205 [Ancylostoma ceylanicum]
MNEHTSNKIGLITKANTYRRNILRRETMNAGKTAMKAYKVRNPAWSPNRPRQLIGRKKRSNRIAFKKTARTRVVLPHRKVRECRYIGRSYGYRSRPGTTSDIAMGMSDLLTRKPPPP